MNRFNPLIFAVLLTASCGGFLKDRSVGPAPAWKQTLGPVQEASGDVPAPDPAFSGAGWFWKTEQGPPETVALRSEPSKDTPVLRHLPGGRIEHLEKTKDVWRLKTIEDLSHQVISRYAPPLVLYPPDSSPLAQKGKITVYNRNAPDQKRDEGTWEETSRWEGLQELNTPAGRVACRILKRQMKIRLGLAQVVTQTTEWYDESGKLKALEEEEKIQALLVNNQNTTRLLMKE